MHNHMRDHKQLSTLQQKIQVVSALNIKKNHETKVILTVHL